MHHTPGPWEVMDPKSYELNVYAPKEGEETPPVEICDVIDEGLGHEMTLANARLIASAPELLGACDALLIMLAEWDSGRDGMSGFEGYAAVEQARAAILKATGRAP